jgi:hypothetical protein
MLADRRLYITARGMLVSESDPAAAYLLAGKGQEIPAEVVKRLALVVWSDGRVMQGAEPVAEAVHMADAAPAPMVEVVSAPILVPEVKRSRKRY